MVGLMDLPDHLWRCAYDDGAYPGDAANEAVEEMGSPKPCKGDRRSRSARIRLN